MQGIKIEDYQRSRNDLQQERADIQAVNLSSLTLLIRQLEKDYERALYTYGLSHNIATILRSAPTETLTSLAQLPVHLFSFRPNATALAELVNAYQSGNPSVIAFSEQAFLARL